MIKIKILTTNVNTQLKILATLLDYNIASSTRDNLVRNPRLGFSIAIRDDCTTAASYITESFPANADYKKVPVYKSIRLLRELQVCRQQS